MKNNLKTAWTDRVKLHLQWSFKTERETTGLEHIIHVFPNLSKLRIEKKEEEQFKRKRNKKKTKKTTENWI